MGCLDVAISNSVDGRGMNHWSIHLYQEEQNGSIYEAAGDPEEYYLNVIKGHDPRTDAIHWRSIEVCDGICESDIRLMDEELRKVPVDNESYNFNCQVWVFEALEVLYDMELIPNYEYHEAYEKLMALHYDTHGEGESDQEEE